jgi:hypothetical protein
VFADPVEWSSSNTYEPLTIVIHEGNSYTSKQAVPKDIDITNEAFWALTGNYNAQVELYRRETAAAKTAADNVQADINTLLPKDDFSAENTVKKYVDDSVTAVQTDVDTLLPKSDFSAENTVKEYIDDSVASIKDIDYTELSSSIPESVERATGNTIIDNSIEIATRTGGNRSGHNIGVMVGVNNPADKAVNIGISQSQAAADFVGIETFIKDEPYTARLTNITSIAADSIQFASEITEHIQTGNVLWVSSSMDRAERAASTLFGSYRDVFENQLYAGYVVEVAENTAKVDGWRELPSLVTPSPSGFTTPTLVTGMVCFVNPLNGLYLSYNNITIPSNVPAGYKAYINQTHIYDEATNSVYSRGYYNIYHSGKHEAAFCSTTLGNDTEVESVTMSYGRNRFHARTGLAVSDVAYDKLYKTGLSTGGALQKGLLDLNPGQQIADLPEYYGDYFHILPNFRISGNTDVYLSDLLPNTEYSFIIVGNISLTIHNDSETTLCPCTILGKSSRNDIPANGSITITKQGSGNAHNIIKLNYMFPLNKRTEFPNSTIRDLLIDVTIPSADYTVS